MENIGGISVSVMVDMSGFQAQLDQITSMAQAGGAAIGNALSSGIAPATTAAKESVDRLGQTIEQNAKMYQSYQDAVSRATDTVQQLTAAQDGSQAMATRLALAERDLEAATTRLNGPVQQAASGFEQMSEALVGIGAALVVAEELKRFGEAALEAYGGIQKVEIAIRSMSGSAEQAAAVIEEIKKAAASSPFSFPELEDTTQRMFAMGVPLEKIPVALRGITDAAADTGKSLLVTGGAFDRITETGSAAARQLAQIGVTQERLAAVMGVTGDDISKAVLKAFKDVPTQAERIDILLQAMERFSGGSRAQLEGVLGAWQVFQNQVTEIMQGVGKALEPIAADMVAFGKAVAESLQSAIDWFNRLPGPVKEAADAIGLLVVAIVPVFAALGSIGIGIIGASAAIDAFSTALVALGITSATTAAEVTTVAEAETAAGTAATAAAGGITLAGVAMTSLAGAVGAVIGYNLGNWLEENSKFARDLGSTLALLADFYVPGLVRAIDTLRQKLHLQTQEEADTAEQIKNLQNQIALAGYTVDRGNLSNQEYIDKLIAVRAEIADLIPEVVKKAAADEDSTKKLKENVKAYVDVGDVFSAIRGKGLYAAEGVDALSNAFRYLGEQTTDAVTKLGNWSVTEENGVKVLRAHSDALTTANDEQFTFQTTLENGVTVMREISDATGKATKATQDFSDGLSHSILTGLQPMANISGTIIDNIKGVDRVMRDGQVTAKSYAEEFGNVDGVLQRITTDAQRATASIVGLMGGLSNADRDMANFAVPGSADAKLGSSNAASLDAWLRGYIQNHVVPNFIPGVLSDAQSIAGGSQSFEVAGQSQTGTIGPKANATAAAVTAVALSLDQLKAAADAMNASAVAAAFDQEKAAVAGLQAALDASQASYETTLQQYIDGTATIDDLNAKTNLLQNAQLALVTAQSRLSGDLQIAGQNTNTLATAVSGLGTTSQSAATALTSSFALVGQAISTTLAATSTATAGVLAQYAVVQKISAILGGGTNLPSVPGSSAGGAAGSAAAFALLQPAFGGSGSSGVKAGTIVNVDNSGSVFLSPAVANQITAMVITSLRNNARLSTGI